MVTDGAAVYGRPDFDSGIQDYLTYQTQVLVSKKPYAGAGGLGLFHRVRYQNKTGYITDTDIRVGQKEAASVAVEEKRKSPSKAWEDEEQDLSAPIYLTRYLGGAVSMVGFTEKYSGRKLSDNMMMYGLRMTGPGTLFDGPPLDFNLWFSMQKPKYLSQFSNGTPTGFLVFGDILAMMPMIDVNNTIVSYGLGLMWVYTRYSIPVKKATTGETAAFDTQEFRMGGVFDFGVGQRFGKTSLLRVDAKYYFEKTSYLGYGLSYQMRY
ncbi:MAG: hypothetical protein KF799_12010 [Bdellovibrionales bacterium]|nr:hypothetical protein [Bdellovibrionales bacterium]